MSHSCSFYQINKVKKHIYKRFSKMGISVRAKLEIPKLGCKDIFTTSNFPFTSCRQPCPGVPGEQRQPLQPLKQKSGMDIKSHQVILTFPLREFWSSNMWTNSALSISSSMPVILPAKSGNILWMRGKSLSPSICFCSCGGAAANMEAVRGSWPCTSTACCGGGAPPGATI